MYTLIKCIETKVSCTVNRMSHHIPLDNKTNNFNHELNLLCHLTCVFLQLDLVSTLPIELTDMVLISVN